MCITLADGAGTPRHSYVTILTLANTPSLLWQMPHPYTGKYPILTLVNAPSAPQISLPSRRSHFSPSVVFFWPDILTECVKYLGFSHMHEVVYGNSNVNSVKTFIYKPSALGSRLLSRRHQFFPVVLWRPQRSSVNLKPRVRMWSSRR